MASLPEDDGPTMVGAPGEQRVATRLPTGHDGEAPADDTTSAQLGPPAAPPVTTASGTVDDIVSVDDDEGEPEEHTVQQVVPPIVVAAAAAAAVAAKARAATPLAPTKPSNQPVPGFAPPAARVKDAKDAATSTDDDDDEPLEDSITATAPRLNAANLMDAAQSGRGVPISIPGRVEIRTLDDDDDDDGADETEVRTRPGHAALEVPVTLRGGSAPVPAPRPAAGRPPDLAPPVEPEAEPDDGPDEDGPTTQAAAPRVGSVPDIGAPIPVKGTAADAAVVSKAVPTQRVVQSPVARADGSPKSLPIVDEPPTRPGVVDEPEELLTRPGLGAELEPPTRPGLEGAGEPATRPGLVDPPTGKVERKVEAAGYANDEDDEDESVTSRAPAAEPYVDDSITTQAPNVPMELIHAAIKAAEAARPTGSLDDSSSDTTQKVRKPVRAPGGSPADEEAESITTQAPGHVTNMLRVIASGSSPDLGKGKPIAPLEDDDEGPENRTAVMANAPLKRLVQEADSSARLPAIRPTGGPLSHGPMGAAAPRLEPSSESGLRVAGSGSGSDERASLGQLMAADARHSGALLAAAPMAEGASNAAADSRGHGADMGPLHLQPSLHDVDLGKGPSYGLLVAIVALISIVVPVTLFVVLRHGTEPAAAQEPPSEPVSEIVKPSAARGKAVRGKNGLTIVPSASVSAAPSAAPSSAPSGKPGTKGQPFGKR